MAHKNVSFVLILKIMGKNMTENYISHPILEFMRIIAELFDAWKSTDKATEMTDSRQPSTQCSQG